MSKQTQKFAENAANSFMLIRLNMGRWEGRGALKAAARKAAADAGANESIANVTVALLGTNQHKLKEVISARAKLNTYLYAHSLPLVQSDSGSKRKGGDRLVTVTATPKVYSELKALETAADAALESFLPEYDRLRKLALNDDMGAWKSEASGKYPSVDELRRRFYIELSPPRPLTSFDPERLKKMGLPLEMAEQIAEAGTSALAEQLEVARAAAIEQARAQMERVAKQLTDGERLHESLVTDSKRVAQLLRDMTEGYDRDPQILALAKLIEDKVATVENTGQWKASETRRAESAKAAATVRDGLKQLAGAARGPVPDKSPKAARVRAGGIMGRKLAAGKAKAKS